MGLHEIGSNGSSVVALVHPLSAFNRLHDALEGKVKRVEETCRDLVTLPCCKRCMCLPQKRVNQTKGIDLSSTRAAS